MREYTIYCGMTSIFIVAASLDEAWRYGVRHYRSDNIRIRDMSDLETPHTLFS